MDFAGDDVPRRAAAWPSGHTDRLRVVVAVLARSTVAEQAGLLGVDQGGFRRLRMGKRRHSDFLWREGKRRHGTDRHEEQVHLVFREENLRLPGPEKYHFSHAPGQGGRRVRRLHQQHRGRAV